MPFSPAYIAATDAEIARLEDFVESIPEIKQLQELRRLRAEWAHSEAPKTPPIVKSENTPQGKPPVFIPKPSGRQMAPERQRALNLISAFLVRQMSPVRTVHLSNLIEKNGIKLGGNDPVNALSALMSTSGLFNAHGRSGWTLKISPAPSELPPATFADAGQFEESNAPTGDKESFFDLSEASK